LVDLQYGFNAYPNSAFTFVGTASTTLNSANIVGSGTTWSSNATANLTAGNLIKIWTPLFPSQYMVTLVVNVNSDTSLSLAENISNNNLVGNGFLVDKIAYPQQAYLDALNSNVVTYWTSTGSKIVGYDTLAAKVCLLGSNDSIFPTMASLRVVSLSA
jgi:hypothetical protein